MPMRRHIAEDEWIDLAAGAGEPEPRRHVEECEACRRTLAEVRAGWDLSREADVPEPSALYWESFRRGVEQRIAAEGAGLSRAPRLTAPGPRRWALLAAASLLIASVFVHERVPDSGTPASETAAVPAWSPRPPAGEGDEDEALSVLAALDVSEDFESTLCANVAECVLDLSEEEQELFTQNMQMELKGRSL
jgi:hypothetical protein